MNERNVYGNIVVPTGYTICVWPGTIVGEEEIEDFTKFMKEELNSSVIYLEEVKTKPDIENGETVPNTGNRNDVIFAVKDTDVPHFALARLAYGIRWLEDVYFNHQSYLYPSRFLLYPGACSHVGEDPLDEIVFNGLNDFETDVLGAEDLREPTEDWWNKEVVCIDVSNASDSNIIKKFLLNSDCAKQTHRELTLTIDEFSIPIYTVSPVDGAHFFLIKREDYKPLSYIVKHLYSLTVGREEDYGK